MDEKKRIGLLSVYNHNYGSILQAYALQNVLESMGYFPEIIKYKKTNYFKQARRLFYFPLLKKTLKMKWKSVYCKLLHTGLFRNELQTREEEFSKFIDNNLYFSKTYKGRKKLITASRDYGCFVLGSDQVWNPMNFGGDFFTMTFVPDDIKKITYAPSFGVTQIPKKQKKRTADYLKRLDFISVREDSGCKIVKELTGREVDMVVDPTILIKREQWDKLRGSRIIPQEYIFCYFISPISGYRNFAKRLSMRTGLKIVTIPHVDEFVKSDVNFGDYKKKGVGPKEFVNLISNAAYVCTDSFHGTVFSILYEKTFFTFNRYSTNTVDSTNTRLYSFLKLTHMENRMYNSDSVIEDRDLKIIDFTMAMKNLNKMKADSVRYLENALSSVRS